MTVLPVAIARAPRFGVVVGARVVLDQIELMALGEGDRRLRQPRCAFVLVGVEVPPHPERNAVDRMPAQRGGDALPRVHSSANSIGRSRAYAEVAMSSGSGSPGWHMSSVTPSSRRERSASRSVTSMWPGCWHSRV